jgi:hypothetical protein
VDSPKFEYTALQAVVGDAAIPEKLNELGKAGWHVVTSYSWGNYVKFVLERPLK